VSIREVAFAFLDCANRGWVHAVVCLLATGAIGVTTVEVALEEATRRERDEVVRELTSALVKLSELESAEDEMKKLSAPSS